MLCALSCYLLVCHLKPSAFSSVCNKLGISCWVPVLRMSLLYCLSYSNSIWSLDFPSLQGKETRTCFYVRAHTRMHLASVSKLSALKKEKNFYTSAFQNYIYFQVSIRIPEELVWRHFCFQWNTTGIFCDRKYHVRHPLPSGSPRFWPMVELLHCSFIRDVPN